MLELVQQKFLQILIGEGRNNFIIEYNENREEDQLVFLSEEDFNQVNWFYKLTICSPALKAGLLIFKLSYISIKKLHEQQE